MVFWSITFEIFSFGSCAITDLHLVPSAINSLMRECQSKEQADRPTFAQIKRILDKINGEELRIRKPLRSIKNGYVQIME